MKFHFLFTFSRHQQIHTKSPILLFPLLKKLFPFFFKGTSYRELNSYHSKVMAFVRRAIEDHKKEGSEGKSNLDFIDSYLVEKETKDPSSNMYGTEGGTIYSTEGFIYSSHSKETKL